MNYSPVLMFDGKKTFNSLLLSIITLICGTVILTFGIFFLRVCTDRKKYRLNQSEKYAANNSYTFDDFNMAFSIRDGNNKEFNEFERLISFQWF